MEKMVNGKSVPFDEKESPLKLPDSNIETLELPDGQTILFLKSKKPIDDKVSSVESKATP